MCALDLSSCKDSVDDVELKEQIKTFIKNLDKGKVDNEIANVALKSATSDPNLPSEGTTQQPRL